MHQLEPTRTRKHGTRVTKTKDGDAIIAACRSIVANGQYEKINGHMVDSFSASAIVKVYDAISDANKAKFTALPVARMASIAFQLLK
jgi:hypothetical protein